MHLLCLLVYPSRRAMNFIIPFYADQIIYYVDSDNKLSKEDNTYTIKYESRVVLTCLVNSHQNITWYKRNQNTSYGIPLSSVLWVSEQHLQVRESIGSTNVTIAKFAEYFSGNYYCVASGSNPSVRGTAGINITIEPCQ